MSIERINSLWGNHMLRAKDVIFTLEELQNFEHGGIHWGKRLTSNQARHLATRFAAKEATIKALGLGNQVMYELNNIEVLGTKTLTIRLTGPVNQYATQKEIQRLSGSCGSTKQVAIAAVITVHENE